MNHSIAKNIEEIYTAPFAGGFFQARIIARDDYNTGTYWIQCFGGHATEANALLCAKTNIEETRSILICRGLRDCHWKWRHQRDSQ